MNIRYEKLREEILYTMIIFTIIDYWMSFLLIKKNGFG